MADKTNKNYGRYNNLFDNGQILIDESYGSGFASIPWVLIDYMGALGLNTTEFLLTTWLLRYSWGERGLAFPSTPKLARSVNVSSKTLYKHLKGLEKKGYLTRLDNTLPIKDRRIRRIVTGFFSALVFAVECDPYSKYCKTKPVENAYTLFPDSPEEFKEFHTPKEVNEYYNSHGCVFDWVMGRPVDIAEKHQFNFVCVCVECNQQFNSGNKNAKRCGACKEILQRNSWEKFLSSKKEHEEFLHDTLLP